MGPRNTPRDPLAWQSTVEEMLRHGTRLKLTCTRCPDFYPVDLNKLAVEKGLSFMAWDATEPCPKPGCTGHLFYLGSPGSGTPFRPLRS